MSTNHGETAIAYVRAGLPVFPLHFIRDGRCTCGKADCESPGKHPLTRNGVLDATTDEDKVRQWWRANPDANIGGRTGSGILVVDCDGEAGVQAFATVCRSNDLDDEPVRSTTGGGGAHVWFTTAGTTNNGAKLHGEPVDVRGDGGYVVLPPSNHASGRSYSWADGGGFDRDRLTTAPPWLLDWIRTGRPNGTAKANGSTFTMSDDLDLAEHPGCAEGGRHDLLVRLVGAALAQGVPGSTVLVQACEWADRCRPPLPHDEVAKVVTDIELRDRSSERNTATKASSKANGDAGEEKKPRKSQADVLVEVAVGVELFHDGEQTPFATVPMGNHRETWPVRSRGFRQWLAGRFWEHCGKAAGSQAMQDALGVLEGLAVFQGDEERVHVRVAAVDDGNDTADGNDTDLPTRSKRLVVDLGCPKWRAVVVGPDGWEVVDESPVKFRRPKGLRPLAVPVRGGRVEHLRGFLNIDREGWAIVAAWLLAAYRPTGPYPILALNGEAGTAKSTTSRLLRRLVDPNEAPLRRQPRNEHDLVIAANNSHVVVLDNLSGVKGWLSDALCRLATGGGFSTRSLYSNDEEQLFNVVRPVILNGIDDLATRGDLLDRTLAITLQPIDEADRLPESEFWRSFEQHEPRIVGALLDAVAAALANEASVEIERLPRMADFAIWATAGERALGLDEGEFLSIYTNSRTGANEAVLESSAVGRAVCKLLGERSEQWEGTAAHLLRDLKRHADEADLDRDWPKNASVLGNELRRVAPNLRAGGIAVEFGRDERRRTIHLENVCKTPSLPSSVSSGPETAPANDGNDTNDTEKQTRSNKFTF